MSDLDFIKSFGKITITRICKELNINISNVYNNIASDENIKKVREKLESEIVELIEKVRQNDKN